MSDRKPIDVEGLFRDMERRRRSETIRSLLAGNDACCFTTAQYLRRYLDANLFGSDREYLERVLDESWARGRLNASPGMVREVAQDVWADASAVGGRAA